MILRAVTLRELAGGVVGLVVQALVVQALKYTLAKKFALAPGQSILKHLEVYTTKPHG